MAPDPSIMAHDTEGQHATLAMSMELRRAYCDLTKQFECLPCPFDKQLDILVFSESAEFIKPARMYKPVKCHIWFDALPAGSFPPKIPKQNFTKEKKETGKFFPICSLKAYLAEQESQYCSKQMQQAARMLYTILISFKLFVYTRAWTCACYLFKLE